MKTRQTLVLGIAAWLVAGCSGGVTVLPAGPPAADGGSPQDSGAPPTDGGAPGSDSGAPSVDSGPWSPICPVDIPTAGTPCAPSEVNCEYGDSAEPVCNTIAQCLLSPPQWLIAAPDPRCPLPPPTNSPGCPASYAEVMAGSPCSDGGSGYGECWYPDGQCDCNLDLTLHSRTWSCMPQPAGCPASPPRIGTACSAAGILCTYYGCQVSGTQAQCENGVWQGGPGGCAQPGAQGSP
jgi:hypothetical protein